MKACIKFKKKILVDVEYVGKTPKTRFYQDKETKKVYSEDELEFKEYYGG